MYKVALIAGGMIATITAGIILSLLVNVGGKLISVANETPCVYNFSETQTVNYCK